MGKFGGSEKGIMECPMDMNHKVEVFKVHDTELQFFTCVDCKVMRMNLDYFREYLNAKQKAKEEEEKRLKEQRKTGW